MLESFFSFFEITICFNLFFILPPYDTYNSKNKTSKRRKENTLVPKILVVLLSLTLIFAFTGCTSSNNEATEDIKTQEVVTSNTDDDDDNISNTENAAENVNEKDYDFSSYEEEICNITKSVNNAKTSTNASENHEQFYTLKKQVDAVDDELDKLDDEFEYAYQMKEISFETYKARERAIEKLEDELELAEEALENKYSIDD